MRRWVDPRGWPVLALGVMLGPGCIAYRCVDAELVNDSQRTVRLEFRAKTEKTSEQLSTLIEPGGVFRRMLIGERVEAHGTAEGGDCPNGPIPIDFASGNLVWVLRDHGAGIRAFWRCRRIPEQPACDPR